jgi:F-type H+-transporting ATPase subunit epsilon
MPKGIRLDIVTPERLFYEGDVELVIVRTKEGDEGFMARHSWACKLLEVGEIWIQEVGSKTFKVASAAEGFIDVKNEIVIFVDSAEWPEEIDVARSEEHKAKAEEYLETHKDLIGKEDEQFQRMRVSLTKAVTRMKVAKGGSRRSKL